LETTTTIDVDSNLQLTMRDECVNQLIVEHRSVAGCSSAGVAVLFIEIVYSG